MSKLFSNLLGLKSEVTPMSVGYYRCTLNYNSAACYQLPNNLRKAEQYCDNMGCVDTGICCPYGS